MTFIATKLFHKAGEGSGGGGGDQHNLGWYATESALTTAHPTASDGDYAIVGATDTVWVWDSDNEEWVDSDQKGQVTSVNGQTGDVVIPNELPSQTGQSGKFLTTDGTDASWSDKPLVNNTTQLQGLAILGSVNAVAGTAIGYDAYTSGASTAVGRTSSASGYGSAYGHTAKATGSYSVAAGYHSSATGESSVAIGGGNASDFSKATATGAIQIGKGTNNNAGTLSIGNANGNFEIMSADGTIPSDRLVHAINKYSTMPTAASTNEGWIVQFTGTTDSTYTHGHLYECVSDGQNPATYSWTEVSMGGGSSYTAGTGIDITNGTISVTAPTLQNTATGGNAVCIKGDQASGVSAIAIGNYSKANDAYTISIGSNAGYNAAARTINIGESARATAVNAMQFGSGTNTEAGTVCFALTDTAGGVPTNYKLLSADGTIPAARHASLPAADGTYTLQLVIADGVPTLSWVAV